MSVPENCKILWTIEESNPKQKKRPPVICRGTSLCSFLTRRRVVQIPSAWRFARRNRTYLPLPDFYLKSFWTSAAFSSSRRKRLKPDPSGYRHDSTSADAFLRLRGYCFVLCIRPWCLDGREGETGISSRTHNDFGDCVAFPDRRQRARFLVGL